MADTRGSSPASSIASNNNEVADPIERPTTPVNSVGSSSAFPPTPSTPSFAMAALQFQSPTKRKSGRLEELQQSLSKRQKEKED